LVLTMRRPESTCYGLPGKW